MLGVEFRIDHYPDAPVLALQIKEGLLLITQHENYIFDTCFLQLFYLPFNQGLVFYNSQAHGFFQGNRDKTGGHTGGHNHGVVRLVGK